MPWKRNETKWEGVFKKKKKSWEYVLRTVIEKDDLWRTYDDDISSENFKASKCCLHFLFSFLIIIAIWSFEQNEYTNKYILQANMAHRMSIAIEMQELSSSLRVLVAMVTVTGSVDA